MRNDLIIHIGIIHIGIVSFSLVTVQGALADCRSENAACVRGARSPFDSVACGSMYRSCAAHAARVADSAQQDDRKHNTTVVVKSLSMPSAGGGRKGK